MRFTIFICFSIQQHILATFFHKQLNLTLLTHTHLYLHMCTHTHTHTHTHTLFQEAHTLVICIIIGLEVHWFWLLYGSLLSLFQSCTCWCQSILGYVYLWNEIDIGNIHMQRCLSMLTQDWSWMEQLLASCTYHDEPITNAVIGHRHRSVSIIPTYTCSN